VREVSENDANEHACSADDWLARTDSGIAYDSIVMGHGLSPLSGSRLLWPNGDSESRCGVLARVRALNAAVRVVGHLPRKLNDH
jgi:hypothetical protein